MGKFIVLLCFVIFWPRVLFATGDQEPELVICSQNLNRYGDKKRKQARHKDKQIRQSFVERVSQKSCDVIALQEVFGKSQKEASRNLRYLRSYLQKETTRSYRQYLGKTNDLYIRNAFLVASDKIKTVSVKSFSDYPLPRLRSYGSKHKFARGPQMLHFKFASYQTKKEKDVLIFNLHFKSKSNSWQDPAKIAYEDLRMEMAEGLREIVFLESKKFKSDPIEIILGDRNSSMDEASADILYGKYHLSDFGSGGLCGLSEDVKIFCKKSYAGHRRSLASLFYPEGGRLSSEFASYKYKKDYYLYDDIVVEPRDRKHFIDAKGELRAGLIGAFSRNEFLDHKMAWLELDL